MKFMIQPPFLYHSITVFMSVRLPAGWLRVVIRRTRHRRGVRRCLRQRGGKAGAVPDAPAGGTAVGEVAGAAPGVDAPVVRWNGRLGRGGSGGSATAALSPGAATPIGVATAAAAPGAALSAAAWSGASPVTIRSGTTRYAGRMTAQKSRS
jgi:hypothetical protein